MKRTIGVAVAVALSMGMMTGASASTPKLSSELLSVGQMPTGWTIYNWPKGNGSGCLANVSAPKGVKQTATKDIAFDYSGNSPVLEETLATYPDAKTAYKKTIAILDGCQHVKSKTTNSTVEQMSFPHYGNASEAFSLIITSKSSKVYDDILIVRKGNVIMGIEEADVISIYVGEFQGFVVKALAKLRTQ